MPRKAAAAAAYASRASTAPDVDLLPKAPEPLEYGQGHQQHHRQQRRGLGRRGCVAAGRAGGELHQQHDHVQRHHRLGGRALQHPWGPASEQPVAQPVPRTAARPLRLSPPGLVSIQNSPPLTSNLAKNVTCPAGHAGADIRQRDVQQVSYPATCNDVFWQNRSFYIGVGASVGKPEPAERGRAVQRVHRLDAGAKPTAGGRNADQRQRHGHHRRHRRLHGTAAELLGHRRARRHGTDQPCIGVHARPDVLGADGRRRTIPACTTRRPTRRC